MKIVNLSLFFFLLISKGLAFQKVESVNIDTLEYELKTDRDFILKEKNADTVYNFVLRKVKEKPDLSEVYYKIYLEKGINENDYYTQFLSYYYLGYTYFVKKDYKKAVQYGLLSIESAEKLETKDNLISALTLTGSAYLNDRDRNNALSQYLKAKNIIRQYDLKDKRIPNLINIGLVRIRLDRHRDALETYLNILDFLEKPEYQTIKSYKESYLTTLQGIGVCYYKMGNYDTTLEYDYKGIQYAEKHHLVNYVINFNLNIGEAYIGKKKYDKALSYLILAKSDLLKQNNQRDVNLLTANYHIATCFYALKEYKKAEELLSYNFDMIEADAEVEKIKEMYALAIKCGEQLNNKELQLKYTKVYNEIIESLHTGDMNARDTLYNEDIADLKDKNLSLASKNATYVIGLLIVLGGLLILILYFVKIQRKNKALYEQLQVEKKEKVFGPSHKLKKDFVTDKKTNELFEKLNILEQEHFFLTSDCSLYTTAKLINTNTTYLSKVISESRYKTFNNYINELRIKFCLDKLKTDYKFRSYTIKAIAEELGYKSVNTFANAFKKQTGLTHSFYIKQIQKEILTSKTI